MTEWAESSTHTHAGIDQGEAGASELALTPGPLYMSFPLSEPSFPEQSARLAPSVYLCG